MWKQDSIKIDPIKNKKNKNEKKEKFQEIFLANIRGMDEIITLKFEDYSWEMLKYALIKEYILVAMHCDIFLSPYFRQES